MQKKKIRPVVVSAKVDYETAAALTARALVDRTTPGRLVADLLERELVGPVRGDVGSPAISRRS